MTPDQQRAQQLAAAANRAAAANQAAVNRAVANQAAVNRAVVNTETGPLQERTVDENGKEYNSNKSFCWTET